MNRSCKDLHQFYEAEISEAVLVAEIQRDPRRLEERKDVNIKGRYMHTTPLLAWSIRSYVEKDPNWNIVKCLLRLGACVDACDTSRRTALMWASAAGRLDVMETIINQGADINAIDDKGRSSLMYACSRQQMEAAKLLVGCGANIDVCDSKGLTPLQFVMSHENRIMLGEVEGPFIFK